jgi:hypothetical protein
MKKLISAFSLAVIMSFAFSSGLVNAQTVGSPSACFAASNNLRLGNVDYSTNGDVTRLQSFLEGQGYFNRVPTGYFGTVTLAAVINFQTSHQISGTGFVGPITRAAISALCGNPMPPPQGTGVEVSSISPASGAIGTQVTIYGSGFTSTENRVQFGSGAIANLNSYDGKTLSFTVPSYLGPYCPPGNACPMYVMVVSPGVYGVTVVNANGTSNSSQFTVVSGK